MTQTEVQRARYFSDQVWSSQAVVRLNLLKHHQSWKTVRLEQYRQMQVSSTLAVLGYLKHLTSGL